jgi:hypothetical protein
VEHTSTTSASWKISAPHLIGAAATTPLPITSEITRTSNGTRIELA